MSEKKTVDIDYYRNGNKSHEIPYLNGNIHGLVRLWHLNGQLLVASNYKNGHRHGFRRCWLNDGSFRYFNFWHKSTLVFEFEFDQKLKAIAPKTNQPIFNTNQFLQLCQRKEQ